MENVQLNTSGRISELKKWDISYQAEGKTFWVECKYDIKATESGYAAIEFEYKGDPSGIETTESDFWVQRIGDEYYIIAIEVLRVMIDRPKRSCLRHARFNVGAEKNCSIWLIPVEGFIKNAELLGYSADYKEQENVC